jgi:hypothetical protein
VSEDRFVPMVLEDESEGTLWIARAPEPAAPTREAAIAKALEIAGDEKWRAFTTWMRPDPLGGEDYWAQCDEDADGAEPYWRMEVW